MVSLWQEGSFDIDLIYEAGFHRNKIISSNLNPRKNSLNVYEKGQISKSLIFFRLLTVNFFKLLTKVAVDENFHICQIVRKFLCDVSLFL